jgi:hypothetical protein
LPKWARVLLYILGLGLFIAPVGHILIKYGITKKEEVTLITTTNGLNMFWTLIIAVFVSIITMYVIVGLVVKYIEKIKKEPFGSISIMTFSSIIAIVTFVGILGLGFVINFVTENTQGFIDIVVAYKKDFHYLLGYEIGAILINIILLLTK